MRTMVTVIITILSVCMTPGGFAADPNSRPLILRYETPGNLESKYDIGCVGAEKLENKFAPTDLYKAMLKCIEGGNYKEGVFLYAVAGVYGRFDTFRVADKTAHQAATVALMKTLGPVDKDRQAGFKDSLFKTLGNPEGLAAVCKEIIKLGPPNYHPRYMVQHGMGAFTQSGSGDGLVKDFDRTIAWKKSLDTYLHCPGL